MPTVPNSATRLVSSLACVGLIVGCGGTEDATAPVVKRPRPVTTRLLTGQLAPSSAFVAASVASWKTEEIGFEIGGRVEWVTEKNATIEGRILAPRGSLLVEGTPIARLDSEAYELAFETAKAELSRAEQQVVATAISLEKTIPAQLRAAEADRRLAEIEVGRSRRLVQTNAVAQTELDSNEAELATAISQVEQLVAQLRSTEADLIADRLKVEQAKQSLRDAERDLENCTLYSSFGGQIAEVDAVPGTVVSSGSPVATIQMMNPIKVEFEVSASDSRLLAKQQELPFVATDENGAEQRRAGLIYQIDPVADPATRTFTVTLLAMNEALGGASSADGAIAVIEKAWRTDLPFLPTARADSQFVIADSIETDARGAYVWRIANYRQGDVLPEDRLFDVSKLRVQPVGQPIPFLGEFLFQRVELADPDYNPRRDLVTGPLTFGSADRSRWNEQQVLLERGGRWLLRPGDLVLADLSAAEYGSGLYVPMDAISYSEGRTFLFFAEPSDRGHIARRVEVTVVDSNDARGASSFRAVQAIGDDPLEGRQVIVEGVHYLVDGEPVRPVAEDVR